MGLENPFSRGPSLKFLPQDGIKRYDVLYRYRLPGEHTWTVSKIGITARRKKDCEKRVVSFLSQKWRAEVEVMRVNLASQSDEMPVQTGDPVEVVTESEYEARREKTMEDTKDGLEERKAKLREQGLWIPP